MRHRNSRSGQVFIMLACGGVFFFLLAAGMIDWIYIYSARARLITAVDAAAVAATRELVTGQTPAEQQAHVDRVVDMIFRANFPDDFMMSTSSSYDPPVLDSPGPGMKRVRVTGHATSSCGSLDVTTSRLAPPPRPYGATRTCT
jgi:Flp pilus assembly protein TadG